jgi:hypothetical protein
MIVLQPAPTGTLSALTSEDQVTYLEHWKGTRRGISECSSRESSSLRIRWKADRCVVSPCVQRRSSHAPPQCRHSGLAVTGATGGAQCQNVAVHPLCLRISGKHPEHSSHRCNALFLTATTYKKCHCSLIRSICANRLQQKTQLTSTVVALHAKSSLLLENGACHSLFSICLRPSIGQASLWSP